VHVDDELADAPSSAELAELVAVQEVTIEAQAERLEQVETRMAELEHRVEAELRELRPAFVT
jgi:hypothetical protein